jgi:hypothetical protein
MFKGRAGMHRFLVAVRNDHPLERKFKQGAKGRQGPLFVLRGAPDAKFTAPLSERIAKHNNAVLGKPQRSLKASPPVVEGDKASWKLAVALENLKLGLREIIWPEKSRTERTCTIATHKKVDVSNMVGDQNNRHGRRMFIKPFP